MFLSFVGDVLLKPICGEGGKDISHWFDSKTKDVSFYQILLDSIRVTLKNGISICYQKLVSGKLHTLYLAVTPRPGFEPGIMDSDP